MMWLRRTRHPTYEPLRGLRVGISGAVPERELWGKVPDLDRVILGFVSRLSGLVLKYGGEIVHGSHPSFTPAIAVQAEGFRARHARPRLTLVASALWGRPPEVAARVARHANVIVTPRMGHGGDETAARNQSLTALRLAMVREADVLIAVGGKFHLDTQYPSGVLEELVLARWRGVPCFIVASYGGAAATIEAPLVREFSTDNLMDKDTSASIAAQDHGVDDYAGRLVDHLVKHQEVLRQARSNWPPINFRTATFATLMAQVDPELVQQSANRFGLVLDAMKRIDARGLHELLRRLPEPEGVNPMDTGAPGADDRRKHYELIQAVVNRLATASFQVKGWTITITTALLGVIVAAKLPSWVALLGLVPTLLFWFLDAYYLQQERLFRSLYNDTIRAGTKVPVFSMDISAYRTDPLNRFLTVWRSRTVWPLHTCLAVVVIGYALAGAYLPPRPEAAATGVATPRLTPAPTVPTAPGAGAVRER